MSSKTLIAVVGPTAIGKTSLAINLAKTFRTEIISADSRQFYKEMTIGTAVPSDGELQAVKHHFIQHKSIQDAYSVGDFERDALALIKQLFKHKDHLILVGGSGLYLDAVTRGLDRFPEVDPDIRSRLNETLEANGIAPLQRQLKDLDPVYYGQVDLHNPHRLIRALEICIASGKAYSSFLGKQRPERPFKTITVGLETDREALYERINARVDEMMARGLPEEARTLFPHRDRNALQTVGYQELFRYFDGELELDEAVAEIKKNSRRYAKRQLTWFRKNKEIIWVSPETPLEALVQKIKESIVSRQNEGS